MATANFRGSDTLNNPLYDDFGHPRYQGAGGQVDADPFGNNPTQVGSDGSPLIVSPQDVGLSKDAHNSTLQDIGADLGFGMSEADKDKINQAKTQEARLQALRGSIPDFAAASIIDPYKDVQSYKTGDPLNLDNAKGDLFNPDGTIRDTAGRGYQLEGANDFQDIVNSGGHDAVSDAYYEQKRASAEQAARAQREAGVQSLQQKGMYNGGAGIMNELYAARGVGDAAHMAALGAAAQQQQRHDSAINSMATLGGNIQSGDDSWNKWMGSEQANYGRDKSNLDQSADVANFNRTNSTNDQNTQMRDRLIVQNHQLPWQEFNAYSQLTGQQGQAGAATGAAQKSGEANPVAAIGDLVDKGAKVVELAHGLPPVGSGTAAKPKEPDEFGDDFK